MMTALEGGVGGGSDAQGGGWGMVKQNVPVRRVSECFVFTNLLTEPFDFLCLIFDRITLRLYCPMSLQKFPMDEQVCEMIFESCEYFLYLVSWSVILSPQNLI